MAGAKLSEKQFIRLDKSIEWSNRMLEYPKLKRLQAIRQLVGYHYSNEGGPALRNPVPLLAMAISIYIRLLSPQAPRALMTTTRPEMRPTAANFELAVNKIPDEIHLDSTLRRFIMEALFSMGIVKVGLHEIGEALGHSYGNTFVDIVTSDDYFLDMSAKNLDQIDYEGNDYWICLDDAKKAYPDTIGDLAADEYTTIGPAGENRAESLSADNSADVFKEKLWLRDVWVPSDGLVVTYGIKSKRKLKEVEWTGPECGPYYKLAFNDVPGNLLPLPPVALWRDLHELANTLFRKLGNQAESQKTVLGFTGGDDESVKNFQGAKDGDGIRYSGQPGQPMTAGGVSPTTLAFFMQVKELSSYFGGNLDSLGGLSIQAQTLGQDKLLGEAASSQLKDMSSKTVSVVCDIFHALAFYEWNDPIKRRKLEKPIPGTKLSIPVEFGPEAKTGDFSDFVTSIDIYSLQDKSPSSQLQKLGQVMQQYVLPLAPMIQQEGGHIDVQAILKLVSTYADLPEISEIVSFPDEAAPGGAATKPQQQQAPDNSQQTTVNAGRPGMTPGGASSALQQVLMGGNPGGDSGQ